MLRYLFLLLFAVFSVIHLIDSWKDDAAKRAKTKPFLLLFLALDDMVSTFDALLDHVLDVIQRDFDLSRENARKLYNQMIIHAHGIACLLVAGETSFTESEVKKIISEAAMGLVMYYKTKG